MNSHKNAKLTARGREEMVRRLEEKSVAAAAADYGLSIHTVRKWKHRYAVGGVAVLVDTSSRPKRCRSRLTREDMARIHGLRREPKPETRSRFFLDRAASPCFGRCAIWASPGFPFWNPNRKFAAMSGAVRETCSIWISSVLARSTGLAIGRPGRGG